MHAHTHTHARDIIWCMNIHAEATAFRRVVLSNKGSAAQRHRVAAVRLEPLLEPEAGASGRATVRMRSAGARSSKGMEKSKNKETITVGTGGM